MRTFKDWKDKVYKDWKDKDIYIYFLPIFRVIWFRVSCSVQGPNLLGKGSTVTALTCRILFYLALFPTVGWPTISALAADPTICI